MKVSEKDLEEQAEEIILEHTQNVEFLTVYKYLYYRDGYPELDQDENEFDEYARRLHDKITSAKVTVAW